MRSKHKTQVKKKKKATFWILDLHYVVCPACLYLNWSFLDSTPVNGESDQKKDDMEVEEKPKSPAQEENNDDAASSPSR